MARQCLIAMITLTFIFGVLAPAPAQAGKAYGKALQTSKSMKQTKAILAKMEKELNKVMSPLGELVGRSGDLRKHYEVFSGELKDLRTLEKKVWDRTAEMSAQGDAYFGKWQQDLEKFQGETLRQRSAERHARALARYEGIRTTLQNVQEVLTPLMTQLSDLDVFLSMDLNADSVSTIADVIQETSVDAEELKGLILEVMDDLENVASSISPKGK